MNKKQLFEDLVEITREYFPRRYVATLGFGSFFNIDTRQKGDNDLDLAIVLNGVLDKSALKLLKKLNLYFSDSYDSFKHAPFYLFSDELQVNDLMSRTIFLKGYRDVEDQNSFNQTFQTLENLSEIAPLTLAKEHTHFARRLLIDNILFDDCELTDKMFKNHTTITMRDLNYLETNQILTDGYDIWNHWISTHPEMKIRFESYKDIVDQISEESVKLEIHSSIIKELGVYQNGNTR